ncbi:MAG: rhodanese-like domain-containing protein [Marinibacterium sp.]
MSLTVKDYLDAANAVVERVDGKTAQEMVAQGGLLLDVRDAPELATAGRAHMSHHIPRGMLEFRADAGTKFHDPQLRKDRAIILMCASGGRAALAGKVLKDMGYEKVYNVGGLKDWAEAGGQVEEPVDKGM